MAHVRAFGRVLLLTPDRYAGQVITLIIITNNPRTWLGGAYGSEYDVVDKIALSPEEAALFAGAPHINPGAA
jgi:hypothetical protein